MLVHSTTLRVHQPFDTVIENSGVKTRSSEQTMLSDEAHISLVTDSSSEEDSETEDHSYLPPEVFALTWHADVGYIMHMVPGIAYFIHQICHLLILDILCANYIRPSFFSLHITFVNNVSTFNCSSCASAI